VVFLAKKVTLMVMATKKPTFKKQTPVKPTLSETLKKKWWAVLLLAIFVLVAGSFAYNKYLDYRNIEDMKTLLADFKNLEAAIEKETGMDNIILGGSCTSIEKYDTTFACYLYAQDVNDTKDASVSLAESLASSNIENNPVCALSGENGFNFSNTKNVVYSCYPLVSRQSNSDKLNSLFSFN
jgi:hypothetical protein